MTWGRRKRAGRFTAHTILPVVLAGTIAATLLSAVAIADSQLPASATITLTSAPSEPAGDATARRRLSWLGPQDAASEDLSRRLVAIPECDGAVVERVSLGGSVFSGAEASRLARVEDVVRIREQTLAVVAVDSRAILEEQQLLERSGMGRSRDFELVVRPSGARGPVSRNAGPFTRVCESAVLNYDASGAAAPVWLPPTSRENRRGSATYCYSVYDCSSAGIDLLIVAADELYTSPALYSLANHHANYLGLNVGIVGTPALSALTAEALRQFIADVYDTQSAAHFGDGHLGFVLLVGDAYADDNTTVMIPTYDGYGGTEVASDHYYACVSGDDDFEDVMIGRLSVGNDSELTSVAGKNLSYMPQPAGAGWTESTLLVAGLFYTLKDEYVALFDEYEELMPEAWTVDRIYRHDYGSDHLCSLDVVEGFNAGHLIVNFAGDGWISSWHQVMDTTDISQMDNGGRLPIVLSMACMTGWYDNTTEIDQTGSYDCFAEQIVNASGKGAIACLAAPRASDGGMFRTLTKSIYRAAFTENCVFLGETMAVAKLLHLQNGGDVAYARHFNLLGDPSLIYRWDEPPTRRPELVIRPHEVGVTPELPAEGGDLTLSVTVRNTSARPVSDVLVRVSDVSAAGSYSQDVVVPYLGDWAFETATVIVPALSSAWHLVSIEVDPDGAHEEIDESNNEIFFDVYAYPHVPGFPADAGTGLTGPCLARLGASGRGVVVMEGEAQVRAIDDSGQTLWLTDAATAPADYGPEIAPAVGDLDGDGANEVVATRRMGLAAFDAAGQEVWSLITDDPVGSPVLADADADGDLDVLLATTMFFGGSSKVIAVDEDGGTIWTYSLPSGDPASATPVVGDFDQDGCPDFAFGTFGGRLGAASCAQIPPAELWPSVQLGEDAVTSIGLADLDADGVLEIAAIGGSVHARNAEDGSELWTADLGVAPVALAVADVDSDRIPDLVVGTDDGYVQMLSGGGVVWQTALASRPTGSPAVADLRGGAEAEIAIQTEDGYLHILDCDGGWAAEPLPLPGAGSVSPFVADLTGDGRPEIGASSTGDGRVFAFGFDGTAPDPVVEWQGPGGNAARSGVLVQPFSGSIAGSATFHGRYSITGDVVIESGAVVTVLPNAVLEFSTAASPELEVRGELRAVGLPGSEVVLRPDDERPSPSWAGLDLKPGSSAALSSCEISGATVGIRGTQAAISLTDCSVLGSTEGAHLSGCSLDASRSAFAYSDSLGMYVSGGDGTITDCTFDGNAHAGLWCDNYASYDLVRNSFTNTTHGDGVRFYRYSSGSVDTCEMSGNAGRGALVHTASPGFVECTITDNGLDGILCRRLAAPTVCWSTISGNSTGVTAESGATPNLGDGMNENTGFNSIMDNPVAAVANYTDGEFPIEIRNNWWGAYPPVGRIFIGYVRYYPCLQSPPIHGTGGRKAPVAEDAVPSAFRLGHCSPNPFNPVTTVDFDVPDGGALIDVSVFDVAGRRVATLYSGHHEPGTRTVSWDGRDDRGRHVASGIYFVNLNAAEFRASRKMVLLK